MLFIKIKSIDCECSIKMQHNFIRVHFTMTRTDHKCFVLKWFLILPLFTNFRNCFENEKYSMTKTFCPLFNILLDKLLKDIIRKLLKFIIGCLCNRLLQIVADFNILNVFLFQIEEHDGKGKNTSPHFNPSERS